MSDFNWQQLDRYMACCNKTVFSKWGAAIDSYLRATYSDYNCNTEVVIIANASMRWIEYAPFRGVMPNIESALVADIKSGQVSFRRYVNYNSEMFIAYAPEIDTLFVRTLFDVKHTDIDPDDKMDIEARLGI